MATTAMTRTFVSLPLPADVRATIGALIERQRRAGPRGLRWVDADQAHLTLAFLGDLEPDALALVGAVTRRLASAAAPFTTDLRGGGGFPNPARTRVLWVGWGAGSEAVRALQARLVAGLRAEGLALEARRFEPHVTLARSRSAADVRSLVAALSDWRSPPWTVESVDVMASRLTPEGAIHTRLERCPLGGGEAQGRSTRSPPP